MLLEELYAYGQTDDYPFHMPGHKRRMCLPADAYQLDITEIDGFDNLHHATGILREEQERMAQFLGVRRSFFLVNGSTCGILSAISAAVKRGGRLLLARNSHKAAYHAVELRGLLATYCYPAITSFDIQGAIRPEAVEAALKADPTIQAVYVTSPTYDGVVSDIASIADIVHAHGLPLIVDEAHGAHFGLHPFFPKSATCCGADVVIQSVHKTLPAFTQSALLHVCSDRIPEDAIAHFLGIYESSSPSYVLMAGMSRLVPFLQENGERLFGKLQENLERFYEKSRQLQHLHVLQAEDFDPADAFAKDPSKILIHTGGCRIDGKQLYDRLRTEYHLQPEMCSGEYVTALCTLMDTEEGFERLAQALFEIDAALPPAAEKKQGFVSRMYRERTQACSIAEAVEKNHIAVGWEQAAGRISGEYVYLYPPGIPLLVPGEGIDEHFASEIRELFSRGLIPEGLQDQSAGTIQVLA